jgi:ankyrin repeat protein
MSDLKIYRNKNMGQFTSFPKNLADDSSQLDTLYLASNFDKLRTKSVAAIRKSKHYASTVNAWEKKLTGVDASDLAAVAKTLGFDVEVFNPLASSEPCTLFSGGGKSKRKAQLLKVKKGVYKPMKAGAVIDELPPDMMRDVVGRLEARDRFSLSKVSRGVREDTIAALPPQTKLLRAVDTGNIELLEIATKEGADVSAKMNNGLTPLNFSAWYGHVEVVRALIQAGVDVNAMDTGSAMGSGNLTPLFHSAWNGHVEVVRALIEAGANVNAKTNDGRTPLHASAWNGHVEVVRALIEAGAEVDAKEKFFETPLHYSGWKHLEVAQALIEAGADVNAENEDGLTPLHLSAKKGRPEAVEYLIKKGADVNAKMHNGSTPLHSSAENGWLKVVRALIKAGADANAKNEYGSTPLHYSANTRHLEVSRALIEAGADLHIENNWGRTPLDMDPRLAEFQRNGVRPRQAEDDDQGQDRNVRQRVGGEGNTGVDVELNADSRRARYSKDDTKLAKAIEVLFGKMKNLNIKSELHAKLKLICEHNNEI